MIVHSHPETNCIFCCWLGIFCTPVSRTIGWYGSCLTCFCVMYFTLLALHSFTIPLSAHHLNLSLMSDGVLFQFSLHDIVHFTHHFTNYFCCHGFILFPSLPTTSFFPSWLLLYDKKQLSGSCTDSFKKKKDKILKNYHTVNASPMCLSAKGCYKFELLFKTFVWGNKMKTAIAERCVQSTAVNFSSKSVCHSDLPHLNRFLFFF